MKTEKSHHDIYLFAHDSQHRVMCESDYKTFREGRVYDAIKNDGRFIVEDDEGQKATVEPVIFEAHFEIISTSF